MTNFYKPCSFFEIIFSVSFMLKKLLTPILFLSVLATLSVSIPIFAEDVLRSVYQPTIEQKLNDLVLLEKYYEDDSEINLQNPKPEVNKNTKGKNKKLKFDKAKADKNSNISKTSIRLKNELANYIAKLIDLTQSGNNLMNISIEGEYPEVSKFFKELEKLDKNYKPDITRDSAINLTGNIEALANPIYETRVRLFCGYFNNPKPSSSAPKPASWHQNPEQTLFSWGYHRTANYATGREYGIYDYTRNITWNSSFCKWNSFRDHAGIDRDQRGNKTNTLKEQKYWGYTPNGKCNPEIHSYVWPYPE